MLFLEKLLSLDYQLQLCVTAALPLLPRIADAAYVQTLFVNQGPSPLLLSS